MARKEPRERKAWWKQAARWGLFAGGIFFALGCVAVAVAYWLSAPKVVAFDAVAPCGGTAELGAKLERAGWFGLGQDLVGEPLLFELEALGFHRTSTTGREGIARCSLAVGETKEGDYQAEVQHPRSGARDTATLFVRSRRTRLLVVDIDGTISAGRPWEILFRSAEHIPPLPDAVSTLRSLNRKYFVVYLTAREDNLYRRTERWLKTHRFPRGPLFCRPEYLESQFEFKLSVLKRLRLQFPHIVAGVGDKPHDAAAYLACGIPAIVLGAARPEFPRETHFVTSWRDIPGLLKRLERKKPPAEDAPAP